MTRVVIPDPVTAEKLCRIEQAAFGGRETPWSIDDYINIGGPPEAAILTDDEIALGLLVMQFAADEGEVLNLGVVPEARRTGVGSDLLQDGINLAQALSISRLFLEVASDNAPARALYRRFSFAEVGVRPRYYLRPDGSRVDAVVMSVEL